MWECAMCDGPGRHLRQALRSIARVVWFERRMPASHGWKRRRTASADGGATQLACCWARIAPKSRFE